MSIVIRNKKKTSEAAKRDITTTPRPSILNTLPPIIRLHERSVDFKRIGWLADS